MLRAVVLSLVLSVSSLPVLAAEVAEVAEVTALRGEATVIQDGRAVTLAVGLAIMSGAVIQTREPGRVKLKFIDGSVVVIGDQSVFKVEHMSVGEDGSRRDARFVLDIGLIGQTVAPARDGSWALRTPTAVTAVRGTEYIVEVRSDRATEVDIRSGEVKVEPVEYPSGLRALNGFPRGPAPLPVLLDRAQVGTQCDPGSFVCSAAAPTSVGRLRDLAERLSGV